MTTIKAFGLQAETLDLCIGKKQSTTERANHSRCVIEGQMVSWKR